MHNKIRLKVSFYVVSPDFIQPEIYNCPSNIFATLSEGNTEVEVTFQEPNATDNSEIMPIVVKSPRDVTSPYRVSNTTTVTYKYLDSFNNTRSCSFRIEVQSKQCSKHKSSLNSAPKGSMC